MGCNELRRAVVGVIDERAYQTAGSGKRPSPVAMSVNRHPGRRGALRPCDDATLSHQPIVANDRGFHFTPPRHDRSDVSNRSARQSLLMQTGSVGSAVRVAASPPDTCCSSSSCNSGAPGFLGSCLILLSLPEDFLVMASSSVQKSAWRAALKLEVAQKRRHFRTLA